MFDAMTGTPHAMASSADKQKRSYQALPQRYFAPRSTWQRVWCIEHARSPVHTRSVAISRVLQCVPPRGGVVSRVRMITSSTCASVVVRLAPGRGSSYSPSNRFTTNRPRHLFQLLR
jgi:hypothetical protein